MLVSREPIAEIAVSPDLPLVRKKCGLRATHSDSLR